MRGRGGLGQEDRGEVSRIVSGRGTDGSPELRDRHRGWKGGINSGVIPREGSLAATGRVSVGTA